MNKETKSKLQKLVVSALREEKEIQEEAEEGVPSRGCDEDGCDCDKFENV